MNTPPPALRLPQGRFLSLDRPRIMGILNITPDSFSDGSLYLDPDAALAHALEMVRHGADLLDLGGQSTRPGAQLLPADEQLRRVLPVLRPLRDHLDRSAPHVLISIDTHLPQVAQAALDAGADLINDVFAGRSEGMFQLAARLDAPIILMHMQGTPDTMQLNPHYNNVVEEVRSFLLHQAAQARAAGLAPDQIILDPGIGFGKTLPHNLDLLRHLSRFVDAGYPVLLGASRKRLLHSICTEAGLTVQHFAELLGATCATTVWGLLQGVRIFRVHDVQANRQAADVAWRLLQHQQTSS